MSDDLKNPVPELDERSIAKRYGLRELVYPDTDQVKALLAFLNESIDSGRCSAVPKTAAMVTVDFLQGTINRQHLTKGPRMSQEEFDALQTPYYVAARIVSRIQRARQENLRGRIYETTYLSLGHFIELLRSLLDPACPWLHSKTLPAAVAESMEALRDFLAAYPDQRRKGRAL